MLFKNGFIRWNGKQVEISSVRQLKLPDGWKGQHEYRIPKGDIDILIEGPTGDRFAVEIKALESLVINQPIFGLGKMTLSDRTGRKLRDDPFPQTISNARFVNARPVLWLPKATGKTQTLRNGVTVVYGSSKALRKAIGVPPGWSLW